MKHPIRLAWLVLGTLAAPSPGAVPAPASPAAAPAPVFPLKDGDVWVMAGDSITAQHYHSDYFEAFCFARYPRLKFAFRNAGVGGHTIPNTLDRFNYDIAGWKPTVVSIELGMNDQRSSTPPQFIANMKKMIERIRSIHARPIIFSPSPVNDGTTTRSLTGLNYRLDQYATDLKALTAKEKVPYADQFHALLDLWGKNKPYENLVKGIDPLREVANVPTIAGVGVRGIVPPLDLGRTGPVALHGDPVHPGPSGQLMMAAALLKELGADGAVSSVTLAVRDKTVTPTAVGCTVDAVKLDNGKLAFDRLDERLPFPIPEEARPALRLYPVILELSPYTLKVTGLKEASYELRINGVPCVRVAANDLETGVNLTAIGRDTRDKGACPILLQSQKILNAVAQKEALVSQWRGLSRAARQPGGAGAGDARLAKVTKQVEEADAEIRKAAKPQKLHFELAPLAAN